MHPTFSEYEATLLAKDVEIVRVFASESDGFKLPLEAILEAMTSASVLYLCTPNNPTGIMPERTDLNVIIRHGAEVGCDVVLDEAFIDFVDESLSFIAEIKNNPHVIVVRSMTKMYAIPGIRLGYIAANPSVIKEIKALAPHWNVNGLAAQIGAVCLQEEQYREQAIQYSTSEREKMTRFLTDNDCNVTNSVTNFISFTLGSGRDSNKLYKDMLDTWNRPPSFAKLPRHGRQMVADWHEKRCVHEHLEGGAVAMVRGKLTFISGGVRSGKSSYAEKLLVNEAQKNAARLVYIASGVATDSEMQARIERHKSDRSTHSWTTFEQPVELEEGIALPFNQVITCYGIA